MLRVARARKGFGAGKLFLAQVDFRLIPELDPVIGERFFEPDAALVFCATREGVITSR